MTRAYGRSGKCSLDEISREKSPSTPVRMEELHGRSGFVANSSALSNKSVFKTLKPHLASSFTHRGFLESAQALWCTVFFFDHLNALGDNQLPADSHSAWKCMHTLIPVRQLIVTCHSSGHKNIAGRRSLENLYGFTQQGGDNPHLAGFTSECYVALILNN